MSRKHEGRYSLNISKDKRKVIEFCELQGNLNDAIAYLVEKEIAENGIRNLKQFIPSERSQEYFESILGNVRRSYGFHEVGSKKVENESYVSFSPSSSTHEEVAASEEEQFPIVNDEVDNDPSEKVDIPLEYLD